MADDPVGVGGHARTGMHRPRAWPVVDARLGRRGVGFVVLAAAVGIGLYFRRWEGGPPNLFFVSAATLLVAAGIVFATRRPLVAAVLVSAMIAIVDRASVAKHKAMDMVVHAYDIIFYLSSWSTLTFLWSEYRGAVIGLGGAVVATLLTALLAYRLDATRIARMHSLVGLIAFAAATAVAANVKVGSSRVDLQACKLEYSIVSPK